MLEVDINELQMQITSLNKMIDDYEDITLNLFNQLKDSCINWQDGNSIQFEDAINIEKNEKDIVVQSLCEQKDVISFICDKYSSFGKKIKFNLDYEEKIKNKIADCKNQITSIFNEFSKIDISFNYSEKTSIINQKNKIKKAEKSLKEFESSINYIYSEIHSIEDEINKRINKLEKIKINDLEYDKKIGESDETGNN